MPRKPPETNDAIAPSKESFIDQRSVSDGISCSSCVGRDISVLVNFIEQVWMSQEEPAVPICFIGPRALTYINHF